MLSEFHTDAEAELTECRHFLPSIRAVSTEQSICTPFQEILILCNQKEKKEAISLKTLLA